MNTAHNGGNLFAELMDTVRWCSLGQITEALFSRGWSLSAQHVSMLLAIEGIDGSVKQDVAHLLVERLRSIRHIDIIPSIRSDQQLKPDCKIS